MYEREKERQNKIERERRERQKKLLEKQTKNKKGERRKRQQKVLEKKIETRVKKAGQTIVDTNDTNLFQWGICSRASLVRERVKNQRKKYSKCDETHKNEKMGRCG